MPEVHTKPEVQRLAAYALIVNEGKILLCRLTNLTGSEGMWTLPGGKVEFGEHPDSTVVREVFEETGLRVSQPGVLTVNSELFHFTDARMHAIRLIYRVRVDGGTLTYEKGGTTDMVYSRRGAQIAFGFFGETWNAIGARERIVQQLSAVILVALECGTPIGPRMVAAMVATPWYPLTPRTDSFGHRR